jgi:hypothetical protein
VASASPNQEGVSAILPPILPPNYMGIDVKGGEKAWRVRLRYQTNRGNQGVAVTARGVI